MDVFHILQKEKKMNKVNVQFKGQTRHINLLKTWSNKYLYLILKENIEILKKGNNGFWHEFSYLLLMKKNFFLYYMVDRSVVDELSDNNVHYGHILV